MLVYRIVFKIFSNELMSSGFQGRWNGEGKKVIYTASSISLAFLENMVRRQGAGFNNDYKIMIIDIPDKLKIDIIAVEDLNHEWRNFRDYSHCQVVGNRWYDTGNSPVLKVPSAVLPEEYNYVINSAHDDFKKINIVGTFNLIPDPRIDEILKKYRKN